MSVSSVDEFAREQSILMDLKTTGHVTVQDLAVRFGVSAVTIRKDLSALEDRSLVRRVRGGAVSAPAGDEGAFEMRLRYSQDSKQAVAVAAARLVRDGDVIALDSSTSSFYLAQEVLGRRNLVVITNGLRHALLFMEHSSAVVLMPGGVVRRSAGSVVGPIGDVLAGRGRISAGFFGVVGISTTLGLLDVSAEEAQTKKFMAAACDRVYALFDSSKIDGFGFHSFVPPADITGMYTDTGADPAAVAEWAALDVPITTVPSAAAATSAADTAATVTPLPTSGAREPARRRRRSRASPTGTG
ncbi:DeoR/GlpR transcriptional regulator [Nakamurella flavida]|uniref:DeoR/GlpR transcriptional regulator n=1 Tax=Nakamurella flavida TaxID=363630 RepID=A0A938YIG8_9ACTN|nr:DeoR/GlpR family DNA-binding transcription regulator [Nakamurella flavida]MBM9476557.1 DeoR/GlpR transcriptional regulator [Nakamurella flavida]MDP9779005.1 DeoR family transcriptional regulator of aga operon [Nakamurella flavida]